MRLYITFLFLIVFCFAANATDVLFDLSDPQFGISQTTNRTVIVQAESGVTENGNVVLLPFKLTQVTGTNGQTVFSNLYGSVIGGFYHCTIPAPPQRADFDIYVQSTNLGLISASLIIGTWGASTYPAQSFAWSAAVSDARYAGGTNQLASYVQIGQLIATSNGIVNQFPSITNGQTTIVYSNPSAFTTPAQSTNIAGIVYSNNPLSYLPSSATNVLANTNILTFYTTLSYLNGATNNANQSALNNLIATNNALIQSTAILISQVSNSIYISSNLLQNTKQPASAWLTNLSVTGAFTNPFTLGNLMTATTNGIGLINFQPVNQTNGQTTLVFTNPANVVYQYQLAGITNGLITTNNLGNLATTNFVASSIAASNAGFTSIVYSNPLAFLTPSQGTNISNFIYSNNAAGYYTNGTSLKSTSILNSGAFSSDANQLSSDGNGNLFAVTISSISGNPFWRIEGDGTVSFANGSFSVDANGSVFATSFSGIGSNITHLAGANINAGSIPDAALASTFLKPPATNGLASTNYVNNATNGSAISSTAFSLTIGAGATNNDAVVSNGVVSLLNGFVLSTNGTATSLKILTNLIYGQWTNDVLTANLVGSFGSLTPQCNSTWENISSTMWSNIFFAGWLIQFTGGNYYMQSNGVSFYQNASLNGKWNQVFPFGTSTTPYSSTGHYENINGTKFVGYFYSTNLTAQISQSIAALAITNGATYPVIFPNTNSEYFGTFNGLFVGTNFAVNSTNAEFLNGIPYYGFYQTNLHLAGAITVDSSMTSTATTNANGSVSYALTSAAGSSGITSLTLTNSLFPSVQGSAGYIPIGKVFTGTVDPNGSLTAPVGSLYSQFNSSSNFLYLRVNTNGASGWQ